MAAMDDDKFEEKMAILKLFAEQTRLKAPEIRERVWALTKVPTIYYRITDESNKLQTDYANFLYHLTDYLRCGITGLDWFEKKGFSFYKSEDNPATFYMAIAIELDYLKLPLSIREEDEDEPDELDNLEFSHNYQSTIDPDADLTNYRCLVPNCSHSSNKTGFCSNHGCNSVQKKVELIKRRKEEFMLDYVRIVKSFFEGMENPYPQEINEHLTTDGKEWFDFVMTRISSEEFSKLKLDEVEV